LLQNADDAGATWAKARVENGRFEFVHDGEDFNQETLQSLCQFGFSNKRHLHTIGFRGVGFKSVFSLGRRVEVVTPTLSFGFDQSRFTQPIWSSDEKTPNETVIGVSVENRSRSEALLSDFQRWIESPFPLLFFQNIKWLEIQNQRIQKNEIGKGPVPGAEIVVLKNDKERRVLVIRSKEKKIPEDALEEIREERGSPDFDLPPCRVQIILELGGSSEARAYTVLPTEVQPILPFSFNAPFIQDPARTAIKHPGNSPTNTWLLRRVGHLEAAVALSWLKNDRLSLSARAQAYDVFPDPLKPDGSINQECTRIVIEGFMEGIKDKNVLLGHDGILCSKEEVISLPDPVLNTWTPEDAIASFAPERSKVLARDVKRKSIETLKRWELVDSLERNDVAARLVNPSLPSPPLPHPVDRLLHLWEYLEPLLRDWNLKYKLDNLRIVPVAGRKELSPANNVLVLQGKPSQIEEKDWQFLTQWIDVIDPIWSDMIHASLQGKESEGEKKPPEKRRLVAASLFQGLKLDQKVTLEQVIAAATEKVFEKEISAEMGIRLAHVAARSQTRVPDQFCYLCKDDQWRSVQTCLLIGGREDLESLFSADFLKPRVISEKYENGLAAPDEKAWREWLVKADKSRLVSFPLPSQKSLRKYSSGWIPDFCTERGGTAPTFLPLSRNNFEIEDFDWDENVWSYWEQRARDDPNIWCYIGSAIIRNWTESWIKTTSATLYQEGTIYLRKLNHGPLVSVWIHKLQSLPCIPDTLGNPSIPASLHRVTPDTQPLVNVEKFVHPDLDKAEYAGVLDILGVRSQSAGVNPLISRLRALSRTNSPPISHLVDLYRAIDRGLLRMEAEKIEELKGTFSKEPLIYAKEGTWEKLGHIFQDNLENIPGVTVVHPEASNLNMWERLEVQRNPTLEMAIGWLRDQRSRTLLEGFDKERATQILRRAPQSVWATCQCWLDITGCWTNSQELRWATTEKSTVLSLFESIKQRTADLSMIEGVVNSFCDSTGLLPLPQALEANVVEAIPGLPQKTPPWIGTLSKILVRLRTPEDRLDRPEDSTDFESDRSTASRLMKSEWMPVTKLKVAPYIEGQPAGPESDCKVVWHDHTIYARGTAPNHHRELVDEISRYFKTREAKKVIEDCLDRDEKWILDYAEEHLNLDPETEGVQIREREVDQANETKEVESLKIEQREDEDEEGPGQDDGEDLGGKRGKRNLLSAGFRSLMVQKGFSWDEAGSYFIGPDGHVVRKSPGAFKWIETDESGKEVCRYWLGRGSIDKGIEIPAEIWNLSQPQDEEIYLVLVDNEETVRRYSTGHIKKLIEAGEVEVYSSALILRTKMKGAGE
jgi:hypothetical protein